MVLFSKNIGVFLMAITMAFGFSCTSQHHYHHKAHKGKLTLDSWDAEDNDLVLLDGQWEFYWQQLLKPIDFVDSTKKQMSYSDFPRKWNSDEGLSAKGYATYRLVIEHKNKDKELALEIPAVYCSYLLWVNGEFLSQNGTVGISREASRAQWLPLTKAFKTKGDKIEIVMQVSNFQHSKGGTYRSIILGSNRSLSKKRGGEIFANILLTSGLAVMFLLLMSLFIIKRNEVALFYFALVCFSWMVRSVFSNLYLAIYLFQDLNWEAATKIEYLTLFFTILTGFMFINKLFKAKVSKLLLNGMIVINYLFIALTLTTPAYIYTYLLPVYHVFIVAVLFYFVYVIAYAIINNQKEAWLSVVSVILSVCMFGYNLFSYQDVTSWHVLFLNIGYLVVFLLYGSVPVYRFIRQKK